MKISSIIALFFLLLSGTIALAQAPADMRNVMLDDNAASIDEGASEDALNAARRLLKERPQSLRKQKFPELRLKRHETAARNAIQAQPAPFGLVWGATIANTKNQGIVLTPIDEKDHPNSYSATKLPKAISEIKSVSLSFGEENKLWRILGYGRPINDDSSATKVLQEYQIFSALLNKKYGNKQEFFTPAKIDIVEKDSRGKDITVQKDAPKGNKDFLSQLEQGSAVLYSTFHNDEVGVALAINVDGDKKSYIVIDYKNLKILQEQEKRTIEAL